MQNKIKYSLVASLIIACWNLHAQSPAPLKIAFEFPEYDVVPEGIAYEPGSKSFFVGSTYRRNIIRIDNKGGYSNFVQEKQDGLQGVIGMRVDPGGKYLWAANSNVGSAMPIKDADSLADGQTALHKYEIKTGKLAAKYPLGSKNDRHGFNDLVVTRSGRVFVTDTRAGKLYTVPEDGKSIELFYEFTQGIPNGIDITPDGKYLFVALYAQPKNIFARMEIKTKALHTVELNEAWIAGADGLYFYKNSLVAIIPGRGVNKIIQYRLDPTLSKATEQIILIDNDPLLSQPTTGVIVNTDLYFVATSNLQLFAKRFRETNGEFDVKEMAPLRIGLVGLQ